MEYFRAIYERYQRAGRKLTYVTLNEFCLTTGDMWKHAIRLLNGSRPGKMRRRTLNYGQQLLGTLKAIAAATG